MYVDSLTDGTTLRIENIFACKRKRNVTIVFLLTISCFDYLVASCKLLASRHVLIFFQSINRTQHKMYSADMSPENGRRMVAAVETIVKWCRTVARVYWHFIQPTRRGWQRGSVTGRCSLAGRLIELCMIYGGHVTTSWVKCPLLVNQPGQLSLPSLRGW